MGGNISAVYMLLKNPSSPPMMLNINQVKTAKPVDNRAMMATSIFFILSIRVGTYGYLNVIGAGEPVDTVLINFSDVGDVWIRPVSPDIVHVYTKQTDHSTPILLYTYPAVNMILRRISNAKTIAMWG